MKHTNVDGSGTIISTQANAQIDLSFVDNTTVLALGNDDQIHLGSPGSGDDEGVGNRIFVSGTRSVVDIGQSGNSTGNAIYLRGSNETVDGAGFPGSHDQVEVDGKDASVTLGGYNAVTLNGKDADVTILPTQDAGAFDPFGQNSVVATGSEKQTVTGAGADFSFSGGSGHYTVSGGSAENSTISGGSGGGLFTGGYYNNANVFLPSGGYYSGSNLLIAGTEKSTLVGALHGSSVLDASGTVGDVLIAGEYGADTMSGAGSTAGNLFEGYTGPYAATDDPAVPSLVIQAGSGNDTLVAGLAAETLTGGSGHDLFRFVAHAAGALPQGGNTTLITDFMPGTDKIDLQGFSVTSEQVVASETISGGSTLLTLPGGVHITLAHVTDLSPKNFTHS